MASGSHTLRVRAVDKAGNVGTATTYTWNIDTISPKAAVTTPTVPINAANGNTNTNTITSSDTGGSGIDPATFATGNITANNEATVTGIAVAGNAVTYTITAPAAATWSASAQGTYIIARWSFSVVDALKAATLATLTSFEFEIANARVAKFVLAVPSNATAGSPFSLTATVFDADGNKMKNYFGRR